MSPRPTRALALAILTAGLALPPGTSWAARPVGSGTVTDAALTRVGTRRVTVGKGRVREEGAPYDQGSYIAPNERARPFTAVLRGRAAKGSIVSVGTFRSLHAASAALEGLAHAPVGFRAVMLDIDPPATRFNASLIGYLRDGKATRGGTNALLRDATKPRAPGEPYHFRWSDAPEAAAGAEALVRKSLSVARGTTTVGERVDAILADPAESKATIFGSDARFARVRGLAQAGKLVAVNGSLTGKRTMRSLGSAFRKNGERVAVVDVSNVPEWIRAGESPGSTLPGLVANIRKLPLTPDAIVLMTRRTPWNSPARGTLGGDAVALDWEYFAIPASDLVAAQKLGYLRSDRDTPRAWAAFFDHIVSIAPPSLNAASAPKQGFTASMPRYEPYQPRVRPAPPAVAGAPTASP